MNDLGLDLTPRTRGRAARPVMLERGRDLEEADIALLETERGIKPPTLVQLRDRHHALARLLGLGYSPGECAAQTGYSLSRISILSSDPSFRELVEFYKGRADAEVVVETRARMTAILDDSLELIHERMQDEPSSFEIRDLHDQVKIMADRTGHGPQTKSTNVNVNVDIASRMAAGRARAESFRQGGPPPPLLDEKGEPVA